MRDDTAVPATLERVRRHLVGRKRPVTVRAAVSLGLWPCFA
jgi:hypothetical protein